MALGRAIVEQIMRDYVQGEILPKEEVIEALADAAEMTDHEVKNVYRRAYAAGGGEGDPWDPPAVA